MSRYTGPASITLNGDKKLAARYISEGRKYLGGLKVTSPVQTAVRELTNAEGVNFRVGYYGGQPFIEITAGAKKAGSTIFTAFKGFVSAPRTYGSRTGYSSNPFVILATGSGNALPWSSWFFEKPDPVTAASHPTTDFNGALKAYGKMFSNATSIFGSRLNYQRYGDTGHWSNKDETLNLDFYGSYPFNTSFTNYGEVIINGKSVYSSGIEMLLGAAAKRNEKGLALYTASIINIGAGFNCKIYVTQLVPSAEAKASLGKGYDTKLNSYASEFVADGASQLLLSTTLEGDLNGVSLCPFNQSATQCRLIWFSGDPGAETRTEHIWDFGADFIVTHTVHSVESGFSRTERNYKIRSAEAIDPRVKIWRMNVDAAAIEAERITLPPYADYYKAYSSYLIDYSYTTLYPSGIEYLSPEIAPKTLLQGQAYINSVGVIKALVDYVNDLPIYGYFTTPDHQNDEVYTNSGGVTNDVADSFLQLRFTASAPVGGYPHLGQNPQVAYGEDSYYSINKALSTSSSIISRTGAYQILLEDFDELGPKPGYWFSSPAYESSSDSFGSGEQTDAITVNIVVGGGGDILKDVNHSTVLTSSQVSEGGGAALVQHLNMRTKTVLFTQEHSSSSSSSTTTWVVENKVFGLLFGLYTRLSSHNKRRTTVTSSTSTSKQRTVFYANGVLQLDIDAVRSENTSGPTTTTAARPTNDLTGVAILNELYRDDVTPLSEFTAYVSSTQTRASYVSTYPGAHGDIAYHPITDEDATASTLLINSGNFAYLDDVSSTTPSETYGVCSTKDSFIASFRYYTSNLMSDFKACSNSAATLDQMLGAHGGVYFTSPFLSSAIAVKSIKQ